MSHIHTSNSFVCDWSLVSNSQILSQDLIETLLKDFPSFDSQPSVSSFTSPEILVTKTVSKSTFSPSLPSQYPPSTISTPQPMIQFFPYSSNCVPYPPNIHTTYPSVHIPPLSFEQFGTHLSCPIAEEYSSCPVSLSPPQESEATLSPTCTLLTVDTTFCTIPTTYHPVTKSFSFPTPTSTSTPRSHPYSSTSVRKPQTSSHSRATKKLLPSPTDSPSKSVSSSLACSRKKSPRKTDYSGEFRRAFGKLLDSDSSAAAHWAEFLRTHGCPKRACIRTYLAFCEARMTQHGELDAFVVLRARPEWRRLGSRTECSNCTSFTPFVVRNNELKMSV